MGGLRFLYQSDCNRSSNLGGSELSQALMTGDSISPESATSLLDLIENQRAERYEVGPAITSQVHEMPLYSSSSMPVTTSAYYTRSSSSGRYSTLGKLSLMLEENGLDMGMLTTNRLTCRIKRNPKKYVMMAFAALIFGLLFQRIASIFLGPPTGIGYLLEVCLGSMAGQFLIATISKRSDSAKISHIVDPSPAFVEQISQLKAEIRALRTAPMTMLKENA